MTGRVVRRIGSAHPGRFDYAPFNDVPGHWLVGPAEIDRRLEGMRRGSAVRVGRSGGGRPIPAAIFSPPGRQSGLFTLKDGAGRKLPGRKRTLVVIGRTHGIETQGTAACMNLVALLESGRCLRGKRWPALTEAASKLRFVVVPNLNIDAAYRCPVKTFVNMPYGEVLRLEIGQWKNGRICSSKVAFGPWSRNSEHHRNLRRLRFLGLRYNDSGRDMNRPPSLNRTTSVEVRGLVRFLKKLGRVDTILDLHAHTQPPWLWGVGPMVRPEVSSRSVRLMGAAQEHVAREGNAMLITGVWGFNETFNVMLFTHQLRAASFILEGKAAYLGVHRPGETPYGRGVSRDGIMETMPDTCLHTLSGLAVATLREPR